MHFILLSSQPTQSLIRRRTICNIGNASRSGTIRLKITHKPACYGCRTTNEKSTNQDRRNVRKSLVGKRNLVTGKDDRNRNY